MNNKKRFFDEINQLYDLLRRTPQFSEKPIFFALIRSKAVETYFWKNVKTDEYLNFFSNRYFVRRLSKAVSLAETIIGRHVSEYLLNNANVNPEKVKNIFLTANISDFYIMQDFFHLSSKIPSAYLKVLIPKAKELLTNIKADKYLYGPEVINWVEKFSKDKLLKDALNLIDILTQPIFDEKSTNLDEEIKIGFGDRKYRELLTRDQYDDLFNKKINQIIESRLEELVQILQKNLFSTFESDNDNYARILSDWVNPYSSGTDIFADDLREILYFEIRDLLILGVGKQDDQIIKKVIDYFGHKYPALKRLAIYVASEYPSNFKSQILFCFTQDELMKDYSISNDLVNLVLKNSELFTKQEITVIVDKILNISPDAQGYPEVFMNFLTPLYHFRMLKPIMHLTDGSYSKIFSDIVESVNLFNSTQEQNKPKFNPADLEISKQELAKCKNHEFWNIVLNHLDYDAEFVNHLSDYIMECVKMKPELLLEDKLFLLSERSYLIISRILYHISESENSQYFSKLYSDHLINLILFITKLNLDEKQETLYTSLDDIRRRSLLYLIKIFERYDIDLDCDRLDSIFEMIQLYLETKSLREQETIFGLNPVGITSAILNDTPSTALRLVLTIGIWENRHFERREEIHQDRVLRDRVFGLIDKSLTAQVDATLMHAVCGLFLPTLYHLDKEYVNNSIEKIFPVNNLKILKPAFNAYLFNTNFQTEMFPVLKKYYSLFISLSESDHVDSDDSFDVSTMKAIGVHLLRASILELESIDDHENLLVRFSEIANEKTFVYIAHSLSNLTSNDSVDKKMVSSVLLRIWTIRLRKYGKNAIIVSKKTNSEFFYFLKTLMKLPNHVKIRDYYSLIKVSIEFLFISFPNHEFVNFLAVQFSQDEIRTTNLLRTYARKMNAGTYFPDLFKESLNLFLNRAIESGRLSVRNDVKYIVERLGSLGLYELRAFWDSHFENQSK